MLGHATTSAVPDDPLAQVHHLDVWMPARLVPSFLRAFSADLGGKLLDDAPDRLRVLLGRPGTAYARHRPWPLSWLAVMSWVGLGSKRDLIEMSLLIGALGSASNALRITVVLRPHEERLQAEQSAEWRSRCHALFIDLHAYLLGSPPPEAHCDTDRH
jgi:hypothetical protein